MQFVKEHLHGGKFKLHPLCNAHTAPPARLDKAARRGYNKTSEIFIIKRLLPFGGIFMRYRLVTPNLRFIKREGLFP